MKIEIRCTGAGILDFEELSPLQGDLKSLSEENYLKLRRSIIENGITAPIHVWKNGGKNWILDGTQRNRVFSRMRQEGIEIPKVPVDFIQASSMNQAKRILLTHASQYGEVSEQGLYEFIHDAEIPMQDLRDLVSLPEIDFDDFEDNFFKDPEVDAAADNVPEVEKPFVKRGELWILGEYDECEECGHAEM